MHLNLPYFTKPFGRPSLRQNLLALLDDQEWLDALLSRLQVQSLIPPTRFDEHHVFAVQTKPGDDEYTLLELDRPGQLWVFLDLSNARQGDEFIVRLYVKLASPDCKLRLHESYTLQDQLAEPVVSLLDRFVPACRLTVTQSRGLSKKVSVESFVRYSSPGGD